MVVNSEQMDESICSPLFPAIRSSPKAPSAISAQATPSRPSRNEYRPTIRAMSESLQPIKKAVVSKRMMSAASCLPSLPTILVPSTCSTPISSTRSNVSCKAGIEPKPPVQMATKRRIFRTSVVSTSSKSNTGAHRVAESVGHFANAEECAPKRSANAQQLAPPQVQSSKIPGGMGEERCTAYVTVKINEEKATNHLPKASAAHPIIRSSCDPNTVNSALSASSTSPN